MLHWSGVVFVEFYEMIVPYFMQFNSFRLFFDMQRELSIPITYMGTMNFWLRWAPVLVQNTPHEIYHQNLNCVQLFTSC